MWAKGSLALALMVALVGCDSATEENWPRFIDAKTIDGTTGLPSPLVAAFRTSPAQLFSSSDRATIASGLSLATWPDLQPIPSSVSVVPAAPGVVPADDLFTVTAAGTVADGWYVALVSGLPEQLTWGNPFDVHVSTDGTTAVRLHVGSAPEVSRIDFCVKEPSAVAVVVRFSESVVPATAAEGTPVSVSASDQPCGNPAMIFDQSGLLTSVEAICAGASQNDPIAVIVGAGLASPAGVGLAPFRAAPTPSSLSIDSTGCNAYKLEP